MFSYFCFKGYRGTLCSSLDVQVSFSLPQLPDCANLSQLCEDCAPDDLYPDPIVCLYKGSQTKLYDSSPGPRHTTTIGSSQTPVDD